MLGGEGVAVLPLYLVQENLQAGELRPIFPDVPLLFDHFRLMYRKDDPRVGLYEALAERMRVRPLT